MLEPLPEIRFKANPYPPWAPRFWNGMRFGGYSKLLFENGFKIHPTRLPMALLVGGCAVVNSAGGLLQNALFRKTINRTPITQPPVFILGHWRSGTTLLHELLSLDDRFAYPNSFDTFVPHHFLLSRWIGEPLVDLLMPSSRPMDQMKLKSRSPQEDEFAMLSSGGPTSYRRVAFPNNQQDYVSYLDSNSISEDDQIRTRNEITFFLKALTYKYGKPLLLKSPPHTGRIKLLRECFPECKFIHISRNPYELVPSTLRLWQTVYEVQSFQVSRQTTQQLFDYVTKCKDRIYKAYFRDVDLLPDNSIATTSFETLTEQPGKEIDRIFRHLQLDLNDDVVTKINSNFEQRHYKKNPQQHSDLLRAHIDANWKDYQERFGYASA